MKFTDQSRYCHAERMSRSPEPFASLKGKLSEGEASGCLSRQTQGSRGGVTWCDCSNCQGLFFKLNLALNQKYASRRLWSSSQDCFLLQDGVSFEQRLFPAWLAQ